MVLDISRTKRRRLHDTVTAGRPNKLNNAADALSNLVSCVRIWVLIGPMGNKTDGHTCTWWPGNVSPSTPSHWRSLFRLSCSPGACHSCFFLYKGCHVLQNVALATACSSSIEKDAFCILLRHIATSINWSSRDNFTHNIQRLNFSGHRDLCMYRDASHSS